MKYVNKEFLFHIVSPIAGDRDDLYEMFKKYNPNDEQIVKEEIIVIYLKPFFINGADKYKIALKQSLAYFLTTDAFNFEAPFDSCMLAIDPPLVAKDFFIWLWDMLFSNESFLLENTKEYKEIKDMYEPNRLYSNNYKNKG